MEKEYSIIASKVLSILPDAKKILECKNKGLTIEEKNGIGNFVTSVDKQLEKYLDDALTKLFPDAAVISEETADELKKELSNRLKFVVDPLDGTTNFTNGWPHTISIGTIIDDELVAGIIYDVLSDKIYTGIKGAGVTVCEVDDVANQVKVDRPTYSQEVIKKSPISYDTPYGADAFKITQKMISQLYYSGASLKTVGPISLDVLKTALGRENRPADYNAATWHAEVRAWDLAAATCILRELGGEIIGKDGKPLTVEILSDPSAYIAFIASGSEQLRTALYEQYRISEKIVNQRNDEIIH